MPSSLHVNPPLIDSHCHVDMVLQRLSEKQDKGQNPYQLQDFCQSLAEAEVKAVVHIASDSAALTFAQAHKNDFEPIRFFYTIGQHPGEVEQTDAYERVRKARLLRDDPLFVAIGEVGLDYYYGSDSKALQKDVFKTYIDLALELNKPLAIHTRDAHEDTLALLRSAFGNIPVIIHCFTGNKKQMEDYLAHGAYISFSGIVTFKNATALQEAAKACPPSRLLLETDAPFLAPVPKRGKINTSAFLPYTFAFLARLRQEKDLSVFAEQLCYNTIAAFGLSL